MGRLDWRMLLCVALIASHFQDATQLVIKELSVPPLLESGTSDHVILDCDYDFEGESADGLVVKWFHNERNLVYQWILHREPQSTGVVEKYIDLSYKASDSNTTWYRAMKLRNPSFELTGDYTCTVSTIVGEDTRTKRMVVYNTGTRFDLNDRKKTVNGEDGVELTCGAVGLYPRPTLDVSVEKSVLSDKPEVIQSSDGLYSITKRVYLKDADLRDPSEVKCTLGIPEANYTIPRELIYYPGTSTTTTTTSATSQRKMEIQQRDNSQQDTQNGGGSTASSILNGLILLLVSITTGTVYLF